MDRNQIKKALAEKGYDFSMLAEVMERSPSLVSKVAARQARSRLIANAIAKILGMGIRDIFPDVPEYHHPKAATNSEREQRKLQLAELLRDE
ncbi:transcriptional regulator [Aliidiomarina iranensis]|uniref:Transcriptional regulator n=1 Tax=Aliidiomarina iranensis TaxID=1434071 RepID=A0A432VWZ5_9GAMM|nr:XRE family transcriptional regulator [Aliidiomarina iranensis]RUO21176.1 transcriptional regulator [Aliidiomarina iranensis]